MISRYRVTMSYVRFHVLLGFISRKIFDVQNEFMPKIVAVNTV